MSDNFYRPDDSTDATPPYPPQQGQGSQGKLILAAFSSNNHRKCQDNLISLTAGRLTSHNNPIHLNLAADLLILTSHNILALPQHTIINKEVIRHKQHHHLIHSSKRASIKATISVRVGHAEKEVSEKLAA